MSKNPRFKKGRNLPFTVSCVAWMDLLGYGSMLREAQFDPTSELANDAIIRLKRFQDIISDQANRYMPAVCVNDGAILYRDLSYRSNSVTADFMQRIIDLHTFVNETDQSAGFPGARTILAVGIRMTGINHNWFNETHRLNILDRMKNKEIDAEQAVNEAFYAQSTNGFVSQLQANFAFTKAYLVDSAGSRAGFKGPKLFIDLNLFDSELPEWIQISNIINWKESGIEGSFGMFEDIDKDLAGSLMHRGALDAQEISKRILNNLNEEDPIKRLSKKL